MEAGIYCRKVNCSKVVYPNKLGNYDIWLIFRSENRLDIQLVTSFS
jgi:hypothetical protein